MRVYFLGLGDGTRRGRQSGFDEAKAKRLVISHTIPTPSSLLIHLYPYVSLGLPQIYSLPCSKYAYCFIFDAAEFDFLSR